jgi:hypothetical protein
VKRNSSFLLLSVCSLVPVCGVGAQWSPPVNATTLNTSGQDYDVGMTLDGLTLYLSATGAGGRDFFRATRTTPYRSFGTPVPIPELSSTSDEFCPSPRIDDLEIFFNSQRAGGAGSYDLWRADRASTAVPFNPPVNVTELNTSSSDQDSSLTADGLRIYFSSTRPGGLGSNDIWTAVRPSWSMPFGTPTPVVELNSSALDYQPHISPDGLTIFFCSDRPGGVGMRDLWVATRVTPNGPFGTPVNVTALNSTDVDFGIAFGWYHDELYFTSNRAGGMGSWDVYSTRFTGVIGLGLAGLASTQALRFSDPSSPGRTYVAASALGSSPGIQVGPHTLPLNFDLLFQLTVGGLPPVMTGFIGTLDNDGVATTGKITFAGFPQVLGLRFFTAFVVFDPSGPLGIKTVSNALESLVQ